MSTLVNPKSSIVRHQLPYNVVEGARKRIINAFSNGVPIYFSMSGGKDSITLAHLIWTLVEEGRIDKDLLTVQFIDEEAMHEPVIETVHQWRKRFMLSGVRFDWYCIEVRHFNCFNVLEQDESFTCFDSTCPDRWVRPMPAFAITDHPMLKRRVDSYQDFLTRITRDGIRMVGVRTAESFQRLQNFRNTFTTPDTQLFSPLYDWRDWDIWRYIRDEELDFPETYIHLYQSGQSRRQMRLSQFFSVDTAQVLVKLGDYDPDLMDKVTRREPNAYLAALYWDTEIFRSTTQAATPTLDADGNPEPGKDHRAMTGDLLRKYDKGTKLQQALAKKIRTLMLTYGYLMDETEWRKIYVILVAGDPKSRSLRAMFNILAKKGSDDAVHNRDRSEY